MVLEVNSQAGYCYQCDALADDEGSSLIKWSREKEEAIVYASRVSRC